MVRRESCTSSKGENVMRLVAHATEDLEAAAQTFRFVPNCLGGLAEVPIAPRARVVDAMSVPVPFPGKLFRRGFETLTTAAALAYHTGDSRLYISSAGHPPALLSRKRNGLWTPVDLSSGHIPSNLPLGARDSADFGQVAVSVEAGDRVALYTDGITECTNASGEEFGQERLCALLEDCGDMDLNATKRRLLEALRLHAGQTAYEDDLTLLLIEISSNNVPNPARGRGGRSAAAGSARAN
jgi:serine/threonine protein phosphatase PrpC